MQWICLLVAMVSGALLVHGGLYGTLLGGLLGLALAQARLLTRLRGSNARLVAQLGLLDQRLQKLEQQAVTWTEGLIAVPPDASAPTAASYPQAAAPAPASVWKRPPGLETLKHLAPTSIEPMSLAGPDFLIRRGMGWLSGGNTVLRIGLVLLFLGLAFLLRYAGQTVSVPIELRHAGVAACGLLLLVFGWRWRQRNRGYALLLQGAGAAVLYLTVFAAMQFSLLIEPGAAFGLLVVVTACSALLAVLQNTQAMAAVAALGAFCAPLLISSGSGNHVALFSYFALLNGAILAIGWFRAWRTLNLIGFIGTFGIALAWGLREYRSELFCSTEPFLVLFFVMYLLIGWLFARRQLLEARCPADYVDGSLLFGPPLASFGLQVALVQHIEFASAFSALALGVVYIFLARSLSRRPHLVLLMEACLALGVIFASLAIALTLDPHWSCAAWAVEGAGVFWLGVRQQRWLARGFALLLQLGATGLYLKDTAWGTWTLVDGSTLGALMLAGALLCSYWLLRTCPDSRRWERWVMPVLACSGLGVLYQLPAQFFDYAGTVMGWTLLGLASIWLGLRLGSRSFIMCGVFVQGIAGLMVLLFSPGQWGDLPSLGLRPFLHSHFWAPALLGLAGLLGAWRLSRAKPVSLNPIPLQRLESTMMTWGLAWWFIACNAEVLRFAPGDWQMTCRLSVLAITVGLASFAAVAGGWSMLAGICQLIVPAGALALLLSADFDYTPAIHYGWLAWALTLATHFANLRALKPLNVLPRARHLHGVGCVLLLCWLLVANGVSDGAEELLGYFPLFNPLDLGLALTLAGLLISVQNDRDEMGSALRWMIGGAAFLLISAMVARTAHHWFGVHYHLDSLFASMQVQAGLSVTWTLIALGLMAGGNLRGLRVVWLAGAGLIALVVAKLFLVELSNHGGLARIVSFIGVGVLLLVVGWFAPLPPRREPAAGALDNASGERIR